jgi:hypothetical protein
MCKFLSEPLSSTYSQIFSFLTHRMYRVNISSMYSVESNTAAPMGLGDFEARQRAMKEQERRRKSETTEMMRQCKSGVSASDLKLAEIKKEVKKSQQDAAKFMHENLSKGSQGKLLIFCVPDR